MNGSGPGQAEHAGSGSDIVPAELLEGRELEDGWRVLGRIAKGTGSTGGSFSVPYHAEHRDGRRGFLKALDFYAAFTGPGDLLDRIEIFTSAYRFERDLLQDCGSKKMSRIIKLLGYGEVSVPGGGVISRVPYLIFELADGDIRAFQARLARIDVAWILRTLTHVALGIEQLHQALMVHQDLKPSNVLTQSDGKEMKLGDLGRADRRGEEGPVSDAPIPGAIAYAPPEQLYGAFSRSWEERKAGDVYLLGSLAVQMFMGHNMTALVQAALPPQLRAGVWADPFGDVLPYIVAAHEEVMGKLRAKVAGFLEALESADFCTAIADMTAPDPGKRGHPRNRAAKTSSYDVRRYVSLFDRITKSAEVRMRKD